VKLLTKRALAKEAGVSVWTLTRWELKGWLQPAAYVGTDRRYTMDGFREACDRSLEDASVVSTTPTFDEIGRSFL
jgi:hypothetical protein